MMVRALLLFAVLLLAAAEENQGGISFWMTSVTMTCPQEGHWFNNKDTSEIYEAEEYTFEYDNKNHGRYHCTYGDKRYNFYVKGKVCENCFELDGKFWGLIIVADMGLTVVVMVMAYKCAKKRSLAALPRGFKAGAHPGGQAPPLRSPDYEPLNPHTRSQGTYSELQPKRMG